METSGYSNAEMEEEISKLVRPWAPRLAEALLRVAACGVGQDVTCFVADTAR
jgi:hypothetical protein